VKKTGLAFSKVKREQWTDVRRQKQSLTTKAFLDSLGAEDLEGWKNQRILGMANRSEEDKLSHKKKLSLTSRKVWENRTSETRLAISEKISKGRKLKWNDMDPQARKELVTKMSANRRLRMSTREKHVWVHVFNPSRVSKCIPLSELDTYIQNGWLRGMRNGNRS
jgi:hypothetical protein